MTKQKREINMEYIFRPSPQKYIKFDFNPKTDKNMIKIRIANDIQRECEDGIIKATKKLIQSISLILQQEEK